METEDAIAYIPIVSGDLSNISLFSLLYKLTEHISIFTYTAVRRIRQSDYSQQILDGDERLWIEWGLYPKAGTGKDDTSSTIQMPLTYSPYTIWISHSITKKVIYFHIRPYRE